MDYSMNKKILAGIGIILVLIAIFFVMQFFSNPIQDEGLSEKQLALGETLDNEICDFEESIEKKAMDTKNPVICYCAEDSERIERCVLSVNDAASYWRATETFDASYCDDISESSRRENCRFLVADSIEQVASSNPQYYANLKAANGEFEEAVSVLESLSEEDLNVSGFLALAMIYSEWGLAEGKEEQYVPKAFEYIEKAKALNSENPEIYRVEGYVHEINQDIVSAVNSYGIAIEKNSSSVLAYTGRGHAYNLLGMLDLALKDFEKAKTLDANREYIGVYVNLCRLQSSRDALISDAIENCNMALNIQSNEDSIKTEVFIILSGIYLNAGKNDEALASLESARAYSPKDPNVYISLAEYYNRTENYFEAEKSAGVAIEIDSGKAAAFAFLSFALMKQGNFEDAITYAEQGLELVRDDISLLPENKLFFEQYLYYVLSDIYSNLGNNTKAEEYSRMGDTIE